MQNQFRAMAVTVQREGAIGSHHAKMERSGTIGFTRNLENDRLPLFGEKRGRIVAANRLDGTQRIAPLPQHQCGMLGSHSSWR